MEDPKTEDISNVSIVSEDDDAITKKETAQSEMPASLQDNTMNAKVKQNEIISIEDSCNNMVAKIAEYLNGELSATSEDYKLLETLNKLTINKYEEMSASTKTLTTKMEEINQKYQLLLPYLTQISLLEESVLKLEQTAYKLDDYSKQLESKFKNLEKR